MMTEASLFEDEAFLEGGQSLEDELLGKGYLNEVPLGSSLAAELQSATTNELEDFSLDNTEFIPGQESLTTTNNIIIPNEIPSSTIVQQQQLQHQPQLQQQQPPSKLASMAMDRRSLSTDVTSPLLSPLQWSASTGLRSRRSSFSSSWSSLNDPDDNDPFEVLKRQLEELNTAVWETKTLHKRLLKTLSLDETLQDHLVTFSPPFEYVIQSVINMVERKSRDREKQTSYLRSLDGALRKEASWMTADALKELEFLLSQVKTTLNDSSYSYENPLPHLRTLMLETNAATESLEELKEIMYVNKRQVQELNSRLRSIAKTVHEVRKDMRRINKFLEEKDDEDPVVLEKGEAAERVKEIMWGLDDLDLESTKKLKQMQVFWETAQISCT